MSRLNPDGLGGMLPMDPHGPSIRSAALLRQGLESFDQVLQRTRQASHSASNPPPAAPGPIAPASRDDQDRRRRDDDDHDQAASTVDRPDTTPDQPPRNEHDESARVEDRSSRDTSDKGGTDTAGETSKTSPAGSTEGPENAPATPADDDQEAAAVDEEGSSEADSADGAVVEAEAAIKFVDGATAETNEVAASDGEHEGADTSANPTTSESPQADAAQQKVDPTQNAANAAAAINEASAAGPAQDADKTSPLEGGLDVETENGASARRLDEGPAASEESASRKEVEGNTPRQIGAQGIEASGAAVVEGETSTGAGRRSGKEKSQPRSAGRRGPVASKTSSSPTVDTPTAAGQTEPPSAAKGQVEAIDPVMDTMVAGGDAAKVAVVTSTEGENNTSARDGVSTQAPRTTATAARQPAATTNAANPGAQLDRARFVQRVSRAFQGLGQQGGTVRLRLHPAELGSLSLEIRVRDGAMTARVEAETSAARTMLLDNLPALRERLAEHDIKVDRFEVELSDRSGGQAPEQSNDHQQPGDRAPRPAPPSRTDPAAESQAPARRSVGVASGEGGQLDVVV